ncbi:DegQ family serine endoprotease [Ferrovibrio sp.]|uniref:DegQ family serine endoprotease n=1 Tax=Ferrovibrio sp. TaxID=1917215 RepID=UPI0025B94D1F|nr:DegQ family serine endoprotease [Ferrovibrio sp.]MBX3456472.1 DegQ family serine endoprotease [Ferrovibrio sp.]
MSLFEPGLRGRFFAAVLAAGMAAGWILPAAGPAEARAPDGDFADLSEQLLPSVVNISTTQTVKGRSGGALPEGMPQFPPGSPFEEFFKDFFDRQQRGQGGGNRAPRQVSSLGSGFIIDARGYIVTNNHVIAEADEVRVILHDNTELPAKIVGRDPETDMAVLKVESKQPLKPIAWGDSGKLRVGEWVLAIGNPLGLGGTVTAGIVSARGRDIGAGRYDDFIQTDASINKGNSGGPLFNRNGEVIGINTAIFSQSGGSIGIGFAVPSNMARPVVQQLIEFGRTKRGWLGVQIQSVTDEMVEDLGLDKARGALVAKVLPGGPAEKAGIQSGDVIVSLDGKPVASPNALTRAVAETTVGKAVSVEVMRKGKKVTVRATLGELEAAMASAEAAPAKSNDAKPRAARGETALADLGVRVAPLNAETRKRFDIKDDVRGVVIVDVEQDGPAAKRDVRAGDVIVEVAQVEVRSPDEVSEMLKSLRDAKRKIALLQILRNGEPRFVPVPMKS